MKSILQTKHWADFKASQNFEILNIDELFVHKRNLSYGQNFLYLPEVSSDYLTAQNMDQIKKLAVGQESIFARVEFIDQFSENADKIIRSFGFAKSFEQVQPKWRHIIDISKSEDEILAQMKSKGRYNIKVAQKHGVKIENYNIGNSLKIAHNGSRAVCGEHGRTKSREKLKIKNQNDNGKIKEFYALVEKTVQREKISGRTLQYFEKMIDNFSDTDYLEIYIASYEGKPLAGALISFYDGVASYLYGGSSSEHHEVMAPYAMHWQIIKDAKERGMQKYDMLGRAKPGDEKSKWTGVTRFKEQFGGEAVEILGSYDFVVKPVLYKLFRILEKIRRNSG